MLLIDRIQFLLRDHPMSFCPECGKSVGPSQKFCRNCGASLIEESPAAAPPAPVPGILSCRTCGAVLAPDEKFCGNCGTKTGGAPAAAAPAPVPAPAAPPAYIPPPQPAVAFVAGALVCRACGNPIKPGDKFCSKCLVKVPDNLMAAAPAAQSPPPPVYQAPPPPPSGKLSPFPPP